MAYRRFVGVLECLFPNRRHNLGAGGKAAKARAAATRANGSLSFNRSTSFSAVSRRNSLSSGWTRARAQRLVVLSISLLLLALERMVASASLGICPILPSTNVAAVAASLSFRSSTSCGTAVSAALPIAPRVSTASRRISGRLSLSFSAIAGTASLAAGPMSRRTIRAQKAAFSFFRASIRPGTASAPPSAMAFKIRAAWLDRQPRSS